MTPFLSVIIAGLTIAAIGAVLSRPYWALIAIAFLFATEQLFQSYFPFFAAHSSLFNYAVGGLALLALLKRFMRGERVAVDLNNPVSWLIYAQFLLWMVAMIYSPGAIAGESTGLVHNLPYLALFLILMPLLVLDLEECHHLVTGMMVVGAVVAVLILVNPATSYYGGRMMIDLGMLTSRSQDSVGNPLATAELGGTVALIAALIAPASGRMAFTVLRVAAFVLGMGLAIGSGSRGQVLATVVAGIMFFPLARRLNNPRRFILSSIGLLILVGGLYATFQLFIGDQNRERWDPALMIRDIALRFDMCIVYIETWVQSPSRWLFGLGTDAWMDIGQPQFGVDYVHNVFVEILCEHGLVGAAIFIATMFLTIRAGLRMWWLHRDDPALRSTAAIFLGISAFSLFNALKQGSITSFAPFYWWLVMAKVSWHEQRLASATMVADADESRESNMEYEMA